MLAESEFKAAHEAAIEIGAKVVPGDRPHRVCTAHAFMHSHAQNSKQHAHTHRHTKTTES